MPIRKHVVTDEITSEIQTIIEPPLDPAELRAFVDAHNREEVRRNTFDGCVEELERLCRKDFDKWRAAQLPVEVWRAIKPIPPEVSIVFGSREWYAVEILASIEEVRHALARDESQCAASAAVVVGVLAAEAEAKHHWPAVQLGLKRRRDTQTSGRGRGRQITAKALAEDRETLRFVQLHRASDERKGQLVPFLAERLKRNPQTIRRRLKRLGISYR